MIDSMNRKERHASVNRHYISFVRKEFRKGYTIDMLPHQVAGIISKPLWNKESHILRVIPGYDTATGQVFRQNINCDEYSDEESYTNYLSDSFMQATTIQRFGENKQTFITSYKPGSEEWQEYGDKTIINVFCENVCYSVSSKYKPRFGVTQDMRRWVSPAEPKYSILSRAKPSILMQALIYKANGSFNQGQNKEPLVDENGESLPLLGVVSLDGDKTIREFLAAMVVPMNQGLPLDGVTNNRLGGIAEQNGNKLFLNPGTDVTANGKKSYFLRPSIQESGKGWNPSPLPLTEEDVHSLWHPWNELLYFMTPEEQCNFIAAEFGADSVNYLIGTDRLFDGFEIPDQIKASGYGRYAKFVDGVTEVAQTVRLPEVSQKTTVNKFSSPKFGRVQQKDNHEQSESVPSLAGVKGNVVDTDKLAATVSRIRKAASGNTTDAQAEKASRIMSMVKGNNTAADADEDSEAQDCGL